MGLPSYGTILRAYHPTTLSSYEPTILRAYHPTSGRQEEPRARTSGQHAPEEPSSSSQPKRGEEESEPLCAVQACLSLSICLSVFLCLSVCRRSVCLSVSA